MDTYFVPQINKVRTSSPHKRPGAGPKQAEPVYSRLEKDANLRKTREMVRDEARKRRQPSQSGRKQMDSQGQQTIKLGERSRLEVRQRIRFAKPAVPKQVQKGRNPGMRSGSQEKTRSLSPAKVASISPAISTARAKNE